MNKNPTKIGFVVGRVSVFILEQSGRTERENRIVVETVREMLSSGGLDKSLWPEAV